MDERLEQLKQWLTDIGQPFDSLEPASADASFRRYFRLTDGETSRIVMDAPPEMEDSAPFVDIAARLQETGVNVPEVLQQDLAQGYVLLSDLGHTLYKPISSIPATPTRRAATSRFHASRTGSACGQAAIEVPRINIRPPSHIHTVKGKTSSLNAARPLPSLKFSIAT
ncbi:MAG TPA: phosphotransferase [Thiohalobacter sp.]|nr:phosphotransferase [Thiohalobacter sp.]